MGMLVTAPKLLTRYRPPGTAACGGCGSRSCGKSTSSDPARCSRSGPSWLRRYESRPRSSGASAVRTRIDDDHYVTIDRDFPTADAARNFLQFLQTTVWSNPQNAPAPAGTPNARIFEPVEGAG